MDRRAVLAGGLAAAMSARGVWSQTAPPVQMSRSAQQGLDALEPLQAVIAGPRGLTVRVASDGCTTKADFAVYLDRGSDGPSVAFGRRPVDKCKAARRSAAPVDLSFSFLELGVDARSGVRVLNPIAATAKDDRRQLFQPSLPRLSRRPTP